MGSHGRYPFVSGLFDSAVCREIHPYCYLIFHCIDIWQCIYSFHHQILMSIGVVSSFHLLQIMLRSLLYISFGEHMYSFLLCISLEVELLGYRLCICSALDSQSTCKISLWAPGETSQCHNSQREEDAEGASGSTCLTASQWKSLLPLYPGQHDLSRIPFILSSPSILPSKCPSLNPVTLPGQHCITYLSTCWPWIGF